MDTLLHGYLNFVVYAWMPVLGLLSVILIIGMHWGSRDINDQFKLYMAVLFGSLFWWVLLPLLLLFAGPLALFWATERVIARVRRPRVRAHLPRARVVR